MPVQKSAFYHTPESHVFLTMKKKRARERRRTRENFHLKSVSFQISEQKEVRAEEWIEKIDNVLKSLDKKFSYLNYAKKSVRYSVKLIVK
jgi:hypothetical protein